MAMSWLLIAVALLAVVGLIVAGVIALVTSRGRRE
jgi:hypothetical protein